ncbi:cytochrome P450 2C23-like [Mercenaria mercenaria]|uniref:cytochrome P450 2C23-like n=1 Tax=Mercenaria mercenaria TaxID=6596 RepID=UPI00234EC45A|nr:cytochrome P450 2C23-like [Mercenaria mercenaria]
MACQFVYDIFSYLTQLSITSFILVITVCILLHYIFFSKRYNPPLPPSPNFKLPLIGHLHLLEHDMRKPFRKYRKQLGDVFTLYFGGRLTIVISGYETLREAFLKNGELFADRPSLYITDIATRNRGFTLANGERWREHRRFALSTLKDFGMGKSKLEGKIHEEVESFLSEIEAHKGDPFDPKDIISTHIANIICFILFKGQFKHDDQRFLGMIRLFDENMESAAGLANLMPWLAEFPGDPLKCKKMISNADKIFEYVDDIIDEHVREYDENEIDDLTSAYIKEMKRKETNGETTTMCFEELSGMIGDLFIAGSHTTTAALRWAIVCLVQFPEMQEEMYEIISSRIGNERLPSTMDKTSLGYIEAFYLEVLRYCTITISSGVHATTRDLTFKGFTIPKYALIMPDVYSALHDQDTWHDPENFRPERFLDENGNIRKREEMIAFFLGKRNCVGESLARMELLLFVGALVQRFRLESQNDEAVSLERVDGVFGLVHTPKPYRIVATLRV